MIAQVGPWQFPYLTGIVGNQAVEPRREKIILVHEIPFSLSMTPVDLGKEALEKLHIDKFCTDFEIAMGSRPYSVLMAGPNPPDFLARSQGPEFGVDCSQFGLTARRSTQAAFRRVRDAIFNSVPNRFQHLSGLFVFVWAWGDAGPADRPLSLDNHAALLGALESYRFDPAKMPELGAELPREFADLDIARAAGWEFLGRPITGAAPLSPFFNRMGFELGFVQNSTHTPSEGWAEVERLLRKHDSGAIQELVITVGGPDRSGLVYPSEAAVFGFMRNALPTPITCAHLRRVVLHTWGTGNILQVVPDIRELAPGYSTGIVPAHFPLISRQNIA